MKNKYRSTKLACYTGYVVQAIVNNFLPILFIALQSIYGLSYEQLARIIIFNFTAQIIIDLSAPKILKVFGCRGCAVLAHISATVGLVLFGILPQIMSNTYSAIIISIIITAFGSGLIEVIISPIVEALPTDNKSGNMAILHSFFCWGQAFTIIITTVLIFFTGFELWYFIPVVWAIVPFINIFAFLKVPLVEFAKDEEKGSIKTLLNDKRYYFYLVMMLCAGACEVAMSQWASMFAQQALKVPKTVGDLAGPCAFALLMGAGRVWYAKRAEKLSFNKTVIVLSTLCFLCYLTVAICHIPFVALICCAFCGFTVSVFWPGILSAGAKDLKNGGAVMFSSFALLGDIGCSLGPWVLGIVADSYGLNIGFLSGSIFPILMIIAAVILSAADKKTI